MERQRQLFHHNESETTGLPVIRTASHVNEANLYSNPGGKGRKHKIVDHREESRTGTGAPEVSHHPSMIFCAERFPAISPYYHSDSSLSDKEYNILISSSDYEEEEEEETKEDENGAGMVIDGNTTWNNNDVNISPRCFNQNANTLTPPSETPPYYLENYHDLASCSCDMDHFSEEPVQFSARQLKRPEPFLPFVKPEKYKVIAPLSRLPKYTQNILPQPWGVPTRHAKKAPRRTKYPLPTLSYPFTFLSQSLFKHYDFHETNH